MSTRTILIVDDEEILRNALVREFRKNGFQVFDAANGRDAFEMIRKGTPVDIVLTDVRMPGGDGIELLDQVKATDRARPVLLFMTAYSDMTLEEAYSRGADGVIAKPFDRKDLLQAVLRATMPPRERWANPPAPALLSQFPVIMNYEVPDASDPDRFIELGRGGFLMSGSNMDLSSTKIGRLVHFDAAIPELAPVRVKGLGIVRWLWSSPRPDERQALGIEFLQLEDDCRDRLADRIENKLSLSFIPKPLTALQEGTLT